MMRDTLVAACLLGALFSTHGMATGMVFVAIAMAAWLPYSLWVILRRPERRRVQSSKAGIWILMMAAVGLVHFARHQEARSQADAAVRKIEAFQATRGRYPDTLEEAGESAAGLKERLGPTHYSNRPRFLYANTMFAFHMWSYDFKRREWRDEYD